MEKAMSRQSGSQVFRALGNSLPDDLKKRGCF